MKIIINNKHRHPLAFLLSIKSLQDQDHDLKGADALMDYLTQAQAALADKAYDADERVRKSLKKSSVWLSFLQNQTVTTR